MAVVMRGGAVMDSSKVVDTVVVVLTTLTIHVFVRGEMVRRECLALGYPQSAITLAGLGQSYCSARQDQSDIVITIEKARQNRR
jgi:hypothetical protein